MAITLVDSKTAFVNTSGGSLVFNFSGSGLADGDEILFFAGNDAGTAGTLTPPAPVSLVRDDNDGGGVTQRVRCYSDAWNTGDGTSYSFTVGGGVAAVGIAAAFRGIDTSNPVDTAGSGNQDNSGDLVIETNSATPTASGDVAVMMAFGDNFSLNTAVTISLEGSLTPIQQNIRPSTDTQVVMSLGYKQLVGSGATGTLNGSFSGGSLASIGQIILLGAIPDPDVPLIYTSKRMRKRS